jgi:hypothetical protein
MLPPFRGTEVESVSEKFPSVGRGTPGPCRKRVEIILRVLAGPRLTRAFGWQGEPYFPSLVQFTFLQITAF